jgi:hypothetical protein
MTYPTVNHRLNGYDRCRQSASTQGRSIVRFRFALALMVAGMLFAAGIASAQSTTTTNTNTLSGYGNTTTSGYGQTTTTQSQPTQTQAPTQTTEGTTTSAAPAPSTQGQSESSVAPAVAAQPAGSAPSSLAFTGGEPLLFLFAGLILAGGTTALLVRDRRRGSQGR